NVSLTTLTHFSDPKCNLVQRRGRSWKSEKLYFSPRNHHTSPSSPSQGKISFCRNPNWLSASSVCFIEMSSDVPGFHNQESASSASVDARIEASYESAASTSSSSSSVWKEKDSMDMPIGEGVAKVEDENTSHDVSVRRQEDDDEEEEDVCRICRNPGDPDNPLRYPCACSGSIKYVHQDCLLQWLNHSNARQCEVCKHPFSFSPVYAENAPARLPFQEFIYGIAVKAFQVLKFFLRLSFVLSVWLLIIPFITFWVWRLAFVRSLGEASHLFLSHMSTAVILTDCLHGFLLSASIVFIFLGATSLRDYFRHLRELGGQDADREEEGEQNGARAARRAPNRNLAVEGNGEEVGAQGIAGAGQLIRRNAEQVAAQWERQAARLEAQVEQMFDGLDDADGAEDVPFDELVGMQGPVFHLVENAFTVLASNMIFLGVVVFVPFSLGRIILHYVSWLFTSAAGPVLSSVMPLTESALSLANITLKNALTSVSDLSTESPEKGIATQTAELLKANASLLNESSNNFSTSFPSNILEGATMGTSRLSDITTLAVGYMFIFSLIFLYLGIVALIRYTRGEPLSMGRFFGLASVAEAIPSLLRQFWAAMRHLMTMIKVAFLLVIELGVFPLMCGWWLDICTIKMFEKSMAQRVEFFSASPLASSLLHWVVGIVYMIQISIFVSLLRGVLRNGVLYFLRDPADPNYNPFRDLIDDPVHKHARRVLLSVAVYGSLIVLLVFLPVKLAMRMTPSIFPLDITVSDPFTEIPADMLLFQICIPFAVEHFKLKTTIKALLHYWFTAAGWVLGLTEFLLPRHDDIGNQDGVNGDAGRQGWLHGPQLAGGLQQDQARLALNAANERDVGSHSSQDADVAEEYDGDEQSDYERYNFVLRIVLLLFMAWMTLLALNSAVIVVPVSLGRAIFSVIPLLPISHGIKCNDLYAFTIGSYVIWTAVAGVRYSIEHIRSRRASVLFAQIRKWVGIALKSFALLSIWIFIIPVLIGLLFELLVIVPMRVPIDESPVFLLYQDWALGLVFLKIWTRLVMLDPMMPLVDGTWRRKFERVREDGFSRLQGLWVLREIVLPIMMKLLTALCVPYVIAKGVFPVLGYPLLVNSAVYRYAWLGYLSLSLLCFCAKRFHAWFTNLHNSIRDDRYLIGRQLHNYKKQTQSSSSSSSGSNQSSMSGLDHGGDVGLRLRRFLASAFALRYRAASLNFPEQISQPLIRRAAFLHRLPCHLLEFGRPPPGLVGLGPHHGPPDGSLHRLPSDARHLHHPIKVLFCPYRNPNPHHVRNHLLVYELLREDRPRHHVDSRRDPLQRGVPAAVRQERAGGHVVQDHHLRGPPPYHQPPLPRPIEKPSRQPFLLLGGAGGGSFDDPDEILLGGFEGGGDLPELGGGHVGDGSEADVDDGVGWLGVEPFKAVVLVYGGFLPPRCLVSYIPAF
ncbi:hypothetical protein V2J09_018361, partial [Rumex salicifolius]